MTSYIAIVNSEIDPNSGITADLMTKLRDNPIAMLEGPSAAPINAAAWHPYNSVANNDGNTGIIYSFAVSGAVTTLESPTFADGYEYMFIFENVSSSTNTIITWELYRETSAAYAGASSVIDIGVVSATFSGQMNISYPRKVASAHFVTGQAVVGSTNSTTALTSVSGVVRHTTSQKIGKVRFGISGPGQIDAGIIYMYRRRVWY